MRLVILMLWIDLVRLIDLVEVVRHPQRWCAEVP